MERIGYIKEVVFGGRIGRIKPVDLVEDIGCKSKIEIKECNG